MGSGERRGKDPTVARPSVAADSTSNMFDAIAVTVGPAFSTQQTPHFPSTVDKAAAAATAVGGAATGGGDVGTGKYYNQAAGERRYNVVNGGRGDVAAAAAAASEAPRLPPYELASGQGDMGAGSSWRYHTRSLTDVDDRHISAIHCNKPDTPLFPPAAAHATGSSSAVQNGSRNDSQNGSQNNLEKPRPSLKDPGRFMWSATAAGTGAVVVPPGGAFAGMSCPFSHGTGSTAGGVCGFSAGQQQQQHRKNQIMGIDVGLAAASDVRTIYLFFSVGVGRFFKVIIQYRGNTSHGDDILSNLGVDVHGAGDVLSIFGYFHVGEREREGPSPFCHYLLGIYSVFFESLYR